MQKSENPLFLGVNIRMIVFGVNQNSNREVFPPHCSKVSGLNYYFEKLDSIILGVDGISTQTLHSKSIGI